MLDGARALLQARASQLQGIVTEVAPRWLARQCCTPQQLLERVRAQPSWQVTCSGLPPGRNKWERLQSEVTCLGRRADDVPARPPAGAQPRKSRRGRGLSLPYESWVRETRKASRKWQEMEAWAVRCGGGGLNGSL